MSDLVFTITAQDGSVWELSLRPQIPKVGTFAAIDLSVPRERPVCECGERCWRVGGEPACSIVGEMAE